MMDIPLESQREMQKATFAPILRLLYGSVTCDRVGFILPIDDRIYTVDGAQDVHEIERETDAYKQTMRVFEQIEITHGQPFVTNNLQQHAQDVGHVRGLVAQSLTCFDEQPTGLLFVVTERPYDWTAQELQHIADASQLLSRACDLLSTQKVEDKLYAETSRYLQILDAIPDLVYVRDTQSRLVWANKAYSDFFDKPLDDLIGEIALSESDTDDNIEGTQEDRLVFATGRQHHTTEEAIMRSDGQQRDFLTARTPLFDEDSNPHLLVGISTDITETKNVERYLIEALQEREQLIELKTNFVSMVSHEFRTPLAVIVSALDILEAYFDRLSAENRTEKLQTINQQVQRLTYLMDDVLLINRGDARGLPFTPTATDVVKLSHSIMQDIQSTYAQQAISIDFIGDDVLCSEPLVDKNLFRHIVQNLLTNAVKYSHKGGEVRFSLACFEDHLKIVMADDGIGIPQANQATLFQSFRRADNVGTIQGTGLGLAIVKRAVDTHGGTIEFESTENRGSTFTVILHTQHDDLVQGEV